MATNCCGRRLSDLLQEHQEPFLVRRGGSLQRRSVADACGWLLHHRGGRSVSVSERGRRGVSVSNGGAGRRSVLCGAKAVRKAMLGDLAGCFSCGARDRFRRLPREEDRDGGRQLSPVSVLQLRSDEESAAPSHSGDEDDSKPSTSGSSSPTSESDHHSKIGAASPRFSRTGNGAKVRAMEVEDSSKFQRESSAKTEHAIVSTWERIAADVSRIPRLVELDLSGSAREWRRRIGEEEARRVGESIEAMIFEEVRWEAVRDMLCSQSRLWM